VRIQETADEVGLTTRSVRYYEEPGLLKPAARSEGDYRLYDETDLERLRFIKGLRDDAGLLWRRSPNCSRTKQPASEVTPPTTPQPIPPNAGDS